MKPFTRQADLEDWELDELITALARLLQSDFQMTKLSLHCEMPHCYKDATIQVRNPFTSNASRFICDRCAKLSRELFERNLITSAPNIF